MIGFTAHNGIESKTHASLRPYPSCRAADDNRGIPLPVVTTDYARQPADFVHLAGCGAYPDLIKLVKLWERVNIQGAEIGRVALRFELRGQIPKSQWREYHRGFKECTTGEDEANSNSWGGAQLYSFLPKIRSNLS